MGPCTYVTLTEDEFNRRWVQAPRISPKRSKKEIDEVAQAAYDAHRLETKKERAAATRARNKPIRDAGFKPENVWWLLSRWRDRTVEEIERVLVEGKDMDPKTFKAWVKETHEREESR